MVRYEERVPFGWWLQGVLVLFASGVLSLTVWEAATGDASGSEAVLLYTVLPLVAAFLLGVAITFRYLRIVVTDAHLQFGYGPFKKRLRLQEIESVESARYSMVPYAGWGIRYSTRGRRAWSVMSTSRGIVVKLTENGKHREYFVSTARPDELLQDVRRGVPDRNAAQVVR